MTVDENSSWPEIQREVGNNVEAIGRQLKRKPPLTHQDFTNLQESLLAAANSVRIIRDNIYFGDMN
jgi:hypothetical protein